MSNILEMKHWEPLWRWMASYKYGIEIVSGKDKEPVKQYLKIIFPNFLRLSVESVYIYNKAVIGPYYTFED